MDWATAFLVFRHVITFCFQQDTDDHLMTIHTSIVQWRLQLLIPGIHPKPLINQILHQHLIPFFRRYMQPRLFRRIHRRQKIILLLLRYFLNEFFHLHRPHPTFAISPLEQCTKNGPYCVLVVFFHSQLMSKLDFFTFSKDYF